jgi:hypothetical protein
MFRCRSVQWQSELASNQVTHILTFPLVMELTEKDNGQLHDKPMLCPSNLNAPNDYAFQQIS